MFNALVPALSWYVIIPPTLFVLDGAVILLPIMLPVALIVSAPKFEIFSL